MRGLIVGVLLAAGSAKRFGSQKLLARLPDGRPVIEAAAIVLHGQVDRVVAVIGRDEILGNLLERMRCEVIVNDRAIEGMGTSIAAGVTASADAAGWLIALGDMPYVCANTIHAVGATLSAAMLQGKRIVVPMFDGKPGHPVGFSREFAHELMVLDSDRGARQIIETHRDDVTALVVDDNGILLDIDTPADLAVRGSLPN